MLNNRGSIPIVAAVVAILGLYFLGPCSHKRAHYPQVIIAEEPWQENIQNGTSWRFGKFEITPLAKFKLRALVLSRERYQFDRGAAFSPVDLALGWGPMADEKILSAFTIHQLARRYYYYWKAHPPIPVTEIIRHSANMHLMPANADVKKAILAAHEADVIQLEGQLISIRGDDGYVWTSSLTREDSGDGSCELVWVESFGREK